LVLDFAGAWLGAGAGAGAGAGGGAGADTPPNIILLVNNKI